MRHALLQIRINDGDIALREQCQVYRFRIGFAGNLVQISVQTVCVERSDGRCQLCYRAQTGIQGLVGRNFILTVISAPETFPAQSHVPVAEVVYHKVLDESTRTRGLVCRVGCIYLLNE